MPVTGTWGLGVVKVVVVVEGPLLSREVRVLALGLLLGRLEELGLLTGILGVRDLVMACTPWKVPARTR
jgi:hypothetical protein